LNAPRALLEQLVDYAGLFPPAALGMERAVEAYAAHRRSPEAWMLGRFVVPAARLEEFARATAPHLPEGPGENAWKIAALVGEAPGDDAARIRAFNGSHAGRATIDVAELKAGSIEAVERSLALLPEGLLAYVEVPIAGDLQPLLRALAARAARAKIRTGGLTAEAFPEPGALARFLVACREAGCAFKATAGLHHPVRAMHPFSYAPASPRGYMHGFLNLLAAAALARGGAPVEELEAVLREERPGAFVFDDDAFSWRSRRITTAALAETRSRFVLGFGSCSFSEPVADLRSLGYL
jgi:hypothetical protein